MEVILIIIALILLIYYFAIKPQLYWKSQHVKQGVPIPLLGDSFHTTFKREAQTDMVKRIYQRDPECRYTGLYQIGRPVLMIRDPELIKQITVKDFDHFMDHFNAFANDSEPIWKKNLFALKGNKWRRMRATLSPTFTASKMRLMFELMEKNAQQYVEFYLEKEQNVIELEMKESIRRFANDVIANCAFGVTVDSLKYPDNEFYLSGAKITNFKGFWRNIMVLLVLIEPRIASIFGIKIFSAATTEFFRGLVRDTVKVREENKTIRPDMIHLLMEARKGKLRNEESSEQGDPGFATMQESSFTKSEDFRDFTMSEDDMTAQVLVFFFAGFETIAVGMSLMCYELAVNPDVQEKLRTEIDATFTANNGKITYDVLNKMKYMDMVTSESLRKHPPLSAIDRMCTRSYTIQPQNPGEKQIHLRAGQVIWLPVKGLHHDEKYYPNPTKFIPERFSDENKGSINPYTYMPFGSGPRSCVASRFALMEVKILIFHILRNFELTVIERTTIPFKYDRYSLNPAVEGGCWIGYKRR